MAETIDWNAPLEAYHPDGRVVKITCETFGSGQEYALRKPLDYKWDTFNADGSAWGDGPWRIRNRKPAPQYTAELVERIRAAKEAAHLISIVDQGCGGNMTFAEMASSAMAQAKGLEGHLDAILADLPQPVDADLELAREVVQSCMKDRPKNAPLDYALAAIQRVRAEKG